MLLTAVANLDPDADRKARRIVYERARELLFSHMCAASPGLSGDEIKQSRSALEQAIDHVEAVVSGPEWPAVRSQYRHPSPPVEQADVPAKAQLIVLPDRLPARPGGGLRGLVPIGVAVAAVLGCVLVYLRVTAGVDVPKEPVTAVTAGETRLPVPAGDQASLPPPSADPPRSSRGADEPNRQTRFDQAVADLTPAVEADPKSAEAHLHRGEAWARKADVDRAAGGEAAATSDLDRAVEEFTEAIKLKPDLAAAYHGRGDGWARKGDQTRAIADLNEAIRRDPNNAGAYLVRAAAFASKRQNDRAIVDLTRAIGLATLDAGRLPVSKLVLAYDTRTALYGLKGLDDRQADDLGKMIELCVRDPHAVDDIRHDGEPVTAAAFLASAYVRRAKVNMRRRRNDDAIADFRKALAIDQGLQEAKTALARLLASPAASRAPQRAR